MGQKGITIPIHWTRTFIRDVIHYAKKTPLCTIEKSINIAEVQSAKKRIVKKAGWASIFIKAMGLASYEFRELRQTWVPLPYPHLYEHPTPIASVAINRMVENKDAVLFGLISRPNTSSLTDITEELRQLKANPIETIALFRRIRRTSNLPQPLRALVWNYGLYLSGYCKAKNMGTFGISSVSRFNANTLELLTPLTSALNYGVVSPNGDCNIRLTFDHRVMDGLTVAKILAYVEEAINFPIQDELEKQNYPKVA